MNTTSVRPNMFKHMLVNVKIVSPKGETVCSYNTDLADDRQRRVFAEQMTSTYAANQASVVRPVVVEQ
jgi:hypothetical protein